MRRKAGHRIALKGRRAEGGMDSAATLCTLLDVEAKGSVTAEVMLWSPELRGRDEDHRLWDAFVATAALRLGLGKTRVAASAKLSRAAQTGNFEQA